MTTEIDVVGNRELREPQAEAAGLVVRNFGKQHVGGGVPKNKRRYGILERAV